MKYIKYIIIFSIGCLCFMVIDNVYAKVVMGGTTLTSNNYKLALTGNVSVNFSDTTIYPTSAEYPSNYLLTMCSDSSPLTTWTLNSRLSTVNIYSTNYKCMFPNSTYTGGHIVYIYGKSTGNCSVTGENCYTDSQFTFYEPERSSWALLSEQYSTQDISIDYASQTIISSNQELIDKNNQLIAGQNNIYDKQVEANQKLEDIRKGQNNIYDKQVETNEKLDENTQATKDQTDTIKDSDTSGAQDSAGGFFNGFDTEDNGGLSSLITSPIKMLEKSTEKCSTLHLTAFDKDIPVPCGDELFWNKPDVQAFRTIWNCVIGGAALYLILSKVFKVIENLKDPEHDKVEVMKL